MYTLNNPEEKNTKIRQYFDTYYDYFPMVAWEEIKEYMQEANQRELDYFLNFPFKNPNVLFWTAFPLGIFGIDRFVLGDIGLGIVKLLSFGLFFIGFIIDSFTIFSRTRSYNYDSFLQMKIKSTLH